MPSGPPAVAIPTGPVACIQIAPMAEDVLRADAEALLDEGTPAVETSAELQAEPETPQEVDAKAAAAEPRPGTRTTEVAAARPAAEIGNTEARPAAA